MKFYKTDKGREPLYNLLQTIQTSVDKNGGWLGKPDTEIPGPNEEITTVNDRKLPEGSHKTIEEK